MLDLDSFDYDLSRAISSYIWLSQDGDDASAYRDYAEQLMDQIDELVKKAVSVNERS